MRIVYNNRSGCVVICNKKKKKNLLETEIETELGTCDVKPGMEPWGIYCTESKNEDTCNKYPTYCEWNPSGIPDSTTSSDSCRSEFDQCGGNTYKDSTKCCSGLSCIKHTDYLSRCEKSTSPPSPQPSKYDPLFDDNIRDAVAQWAKNKNNNTVGDVKVGGKNFGPIEHWVTSGVTEMGALFSYLNYNDSNIHQSITDFNEDITNWDVSNVTDMSNMFTGTSSFNQPIGKWKIKPMKSKKIDSTCSCDTSSSDTNLSIIGMFNNAASFNQNLSSWTVSCKNNKTGVFQDSKMEKENNTQYYPIFKDCDDNKISYSDT